MGGSQQLFTGFAYTVAQALKDSVPTWTEKGIYISRFEIRKLITLKSSVESMVVTSPKYFNFEKERLEANPFFYRSTPEIGSLLDSKGATEEYSLLRKIIFSLMIMSYLKSIHSTLVKECRVYLEHDDIFSDESVSEVMKYLASGNPEQINALFQPLSYAAILDWLEYPGGI